MHAGDPATRLTSRSSSIVASLVAGAGLVSGSAFADVPACAERQIVPVDKVAPWRCELALPAGEAWLARVRQDDIDISLRVSDPQAKGTLTVDAPTRRASPELALLLPDRGARQSVEIRVTDPERATGRVEVTFEKLHARADSPLVAGLRQLTLASRSGKDDETAAKARIAQLMGAVETLRAAGAPGFTAEAQFRIAAVYYWSLGDWARTAAAAKSATDEFGAVDEPVMRAQAELMRAAALIEVASANPNTGRRAEGSQASPYDEVLRLLDDASQKFREAHRPYDAAQASNFLGIALYYQGNHSAARARYVEAAQAFQALGDNASRALPLQNIAMIDSERGDYTRAIESFDALLGVLNERDDAIHYVTVLLNRGISQYAIGRFDDALRSYLSALQLCKEHGFTAEEARSLHNLGMVYLLIGERDRATVFLERALALRRPLAKQDPRGLQTSLLRIGDLRRENGDVRSALKLHAEALEIALSPLRKAQALYSIGLDHEANNDPRSAIKAYESALALDVPRDWPILVSVSGAYGHAKLRLGEPDGRALMTQAAQLHESHGDDDLAAQQYLALADEDRLGGRFEPALQSLNKALALYESQRLGAINPDLRGTYLASRAQAFELQGDLYMTLALRATNAREKARLESLALVATEANRQRLLADFRQLAPPAGASSGGSDEVAALDAQIAAKRHRLALAMEQANPSQPQIDELRGDLSLLRSRLDVAQAGGPARVASEAAKKPAGLSLAALQAETKRDAVLLVYQLGEQRSWLWCVTHDSTRAFPLPSRAEVEQAARTLLSAWSTLNSPSSDLSAEMAASATILGPAATILRDKKTVAVVADGVLRHIPFGALWMDTATLGAPVRLAETHAVTFRPALQAIVAKDGSQVAQANNRILLIGDPNQSAPAQAASPEGSGDPWALRPLPGSRREVLAIQSIAADWRSYVLLGAEATKPAVLAMPLDSFRAIHFATHARLDVQDPQLSSIVLSSRDAGSAAGSLTTREILGFDLHAETVVLSACEGSLGKDYRGQLSFGLSEAFLIAGAHNVLGSLWKVSDEAAQVYMQRFYEQYVRHDATPAAAAQAASRALARDPRFSHPYYWAAFVVTQP